MSHIFMKNTDIHATKEELYNILKASINENGLNYDEKNVEKAYRFACIAHNGQKRYSGDEYVTHSINVAILLSQMEASEDVVIAGLLHDIIFEKTSISIEEIENEFSQRVAKIIEAVTNYNENEVLTDETVIMIRIADRLHNMRTLEFTNEKYWEERAKETLDIFAPIAAKINNEKVIAELNELSLKYIK